jgi:hypothetical protein
VTTADRLAYSLTDASAATGLSRTLLDQAIKDGALRSKVTSYRSDGKAGKRIVLARDLQAFLDGLEDS